MSADLPADKSVNAIISAGIKSARAILEGRGVGLGDNQSDRNPRADEEQPLDPIDPSGDETRLPLSRNVFDVTEQLLHSIDAHLVEILAVLKPRDPVDVAALRYVGRIQDHESSPSVGGTSAGTGAGA